MKIRRLVTLSAPALACALLTIPVSPASAAPSPGKEAPRLIERTLSAEGIRGLKVKGHVGDLRVSAAAGEKIILRLSLESKEYGKFLGKRWGDPAKADLHVETSGGTALFEVRTPEDRDGLKEDWQIEVPARLAARLLLVVGDMEVRGLAGGVDLEVTVGHIKLDVPQGNIRAEVNVGDIEAVTATGSYGNVDLNANVGGTRLVLGNHRVKHDDRPGPGSRVSLEGTGRDRIRLEVNVGDAELTIRSSA